jgi:NAD-dependent deacetylase
LDDFGLPDPIAADLRAALGKAQKIVVFTGAGASAESGVPTFRDAQVGLWERFKPEDLATPDAFKRQPARVWGWYEWRRALVNHAKPNAGHLAIAQWAHSADLTVITQNVDDLHERAGSNRIIHLHGSLFAARCFACSRSHALPPIDPSFSESRHEIDPPRCAHCGGLIRPGVVWFGESLPEKQWRDAEKACEQADLLICLGASALVYPAASLPQIASKQGAVIVQVNPNATGMDAIADFSIQGVAGDVMPRIVAAVAQSTQ